MTRRERIAARFLGRCMYCGRPLGARWHADHIRPLYRGWIDPPQDRAGPDDESNLGPACARCNLRKGALTVDEFRAEIAAQVSRVRRDSAGFRLAEDFGLVAETGATVVFLFETAVVRGKE